MNMNQTTFAQRVLWGLVFAILFSGGWLMRVWTAYAALDVPQIVSYQGRLTDSNRITVDDASYSMYFALYTASSGGTCLWSAGNTDSNTATIDCIGETPDTAVSVTVTDGVFTVLLGDTTASQNAIPDDLFDDNATVYLGVTIGSDAEMTPRKRVTSVPFALQAGDADLLDDLDSDNNGCTSACVPVTDSNGNLAITGNPQSTAVSGGSLYINPASADADEVILGVALGGSARFTVDEDGDVRIGGGAANATISLYNSNNTAATITGTRYGGSYDAIQINGILDSPSGFAASGIVSVAASVNTDASVYIAPTTFSGNQGGNADDAGVFSNISSSATTTSGAYSFMGVKSRLEYNGTGTGTTVYGEDVRATLTTTTLGSAYGDYVQVSNEGSGTTTSGYGVYATAQNNSSTATLTNAYGIYGYANEVSGTITTGYGGYFRSVNAGTNFAVYTGEGRVQIEGDTTATTPDNATGDGDLFVKGNVETDDTLYLDYTSTDTTLGTEYGLDLSFQHTGVTTASGADRSVGLYMDLDRTGATGAATRVDAAAIQVQATSDTLAQLNNTFGIYIEASGGDNNHAIYAGAGYLHMDNDLTRDAPTFGSVGANGSAFFYNDVEIYDGSLCVGDGSTNDCSGISPTDGQIYSTSATVNAHDLAETFPSKQVLLAGELVAVSSSATTSSVGATSSSLGSSPRRNPITIQSTAIGDRITTSSVPGVGKRASEASDVIGVAMEAFSGDGQGSVMTFVQIHHWDGEATTSVTQKEPEPSVQPNAVLTVNNGAISNIARLSGMYWTIDELGVLTTRGSYDVQVDSYQNTQVTTHAVLGMEHYITMSGTTEMEDESIVVEFEDLDPEFNDIISTEVPIVVTATVSNGSGTAYITDKSSNGFTLHRTVGSGTSVDWIVIGLRRGLEPKDELVAPTDEVVAEEETATEEGVADVIDSEVSETVVEVEQTETAQPSELPIENEEVSAEGDAVTEEESAVPEEIVAQEVAEAAEVEAAPDVVETVTSESVETTITESTQSSVAPNEESAQSESADTSVQP
ncbi:hypothetical protein HYV72_00100 [Candidatus Uhrbacteria bacterium]|nr:hypothetical protein [Candidatus Uhrbacteria bacterium]